ncbi:MAG: GGDEF domain-containing protein [Candidatus Berkelbacteria bacterium]|nr:GGDEF domain-containing protein [Candidatus Berkelbacteria bacterium]MCR4306996.1 GGDEF domain-containing protein [Candidatus Berkelbacteria bacterium]
MAEIKNEQRIIELEREISQLKSRLTTDELTKILNRRGLIEILRPWAREVAYQLANPDRRKALIVRALSLVFADIDHFKKVNDTYGHLAGDLVLKTVAKILRENVREIDIVGRYGGEEIVLGLIGANLSDSKKISEHLRKKIADTPIKFRDQMIKVTASFGVATLSANLNLEELIKNADEALYRAKNSGRNKVVTSS